MHVSHILRLTDLSYLASGVAEGVCTALLGLSNMGKSTLLRTLCEPGLAERLALSVERRALSTESVDVKSPPDVPRSTLYVYVDCNLMLELSAQGFYEVVLRALLASLSPSLPPASLPKLGERGAEVKGGSGGEPGLVERVRACYQQVLEPSSPLRVPLSFNEALAAATEGTDGRLALLLDEFDEALAALDGRVFLNLRALYDQFNGRLCYITATSQPLEQVRPSEDCGEFCELFAGRTRWLGVLTPEDARSIIAEHAQRAGVKLNPEEVAFIADQAGGHPGLLQAVTSAVLQAGAGQPADTEVDALPARSQEGGYSYFAWLAPRLDEDEIVRNECTKLWRQLTPGEQESLLAYLSFRPSTDGGGEAREMSQAAPASLREKSILIGDPPRVFSRLFEAYARRRATAHGPARGVHIDVEAGNVWVDDRPVQNLTDLEYRLLLLLYGRLDKLCDKYQIVEAVWGQEYIDEVDDARIEKLVSRLRSKLEPDPANPHYLLTLRGRGYKLIRG